jgi:hypothetical protein
VLTVRAVYHRREGSTALLPESLRGAPRPEVHAFGTTAALRVWWGPRGWQCALPAGDRDAVRLIARVSRTPALPRMFHTRWPEVRPNVAPTRRVAIVPRDLIEGAPDGWTCPDEPDADVPCVSHERAPGAVVTRVASAPSPPGAWTLATLLTTASLVAVGWSPSRRAERTVAALGGVAASLSVCLSLVGAHATSWGASAAWLLPLGALVGARAPSTRWGRAVGAAALVFVPLLAVAGTPAPMVFSLAALLAATVFGASLAGPS